MKKNKLANVYNLIQVTDKKENALSVSFANILINDTILLKGFLSKLGFRVAQSELEQIEIDTELSYYGIDENSRIDIRITLANKFVVFIESKILDNKFSESQIKKYARKLYELKKESFEKVKLCLVTQIDEKHRFKKAIEKCRYLSKKEYVYFRWNEVTKFIETKMGDSYKFLVKKFLEFMGDKMEDRTIVGEIPLSELRNEAVAVILRTKQEQDAVIKGEKINGRIVHRYVCPVNYIQDTLYIAFYFIHPVSMIKYIAKVKERVIDSKEKVGRGWFAHLDKKVTREKGKLVRVVILEKPVELRSPILRGSCPVRGYKKYTTLAKLISAKTLSDL